MIRVTKFVLKRPVTTLLVVLSLFFFGVMSLFSSKLELTPEINMPMLVVMTTYPGASPKDVDELITKEIEENVGTLSGIDTLTGLSSENFSLVLLQYEYGTDMDNAYSDLRKRIDQARTGLPEDANEPVIYELDVNQSASMYVTVKNSGVNNVLNYANKYVVPELEKIASVASVDAYGGQQDYIRICLNPEKLARYHLDINSVAQLVGAASFTIPAGSASVGSTELSISAGVKYKTPEELKRIPITYGAGNIIYLEDIADVYRTQEKQGAIGRYNGEDVVMLGLNRNQKYTAVNVSNAAKKVFSEIEAADPNVKFIIINDSADDILDSIRTMLKTMAAAVVICTIVLFLFYGDVKASLIVATSIPVSIMTAFVMMWARGYSLNVITLGSMVLGVGMMVDNSIVILEACFRSMEEHPGQSMKDYMHSAV
ncbi:MAG: efflux RND transporter permease subunit, partial [Lachnospiraceae bacterium]|nr:efflux RND transporter permease subunit [Lachnospiraceae bacterium]